MAPHLIDKEPQTYDRSLSHLLHLLLHILFLLLLLLPWPLAGLYFITNRKSHLVIHPLPPPRTPERPTSWPAFLLVRLFLSFVLLLSSPPPPRKPTHSLRTPPLPPSPSPSNPLSCCCCSLCLRRKEMVIVRFNWERGRQEGGEKIM